MVATMVLAGCGPEGLENVSNTGGVTIALPPPHPYQAPVANELAEAEAPETIIEEVAEPEQERAPADPATATAAAAETPPADPPASAAEPSTAEVAQEPSERPPLPDETIAGTIRRIGYTCPAVTATSRMESADGAPAYRITCSSGDSYRGSLQQGRMRFRKLER